MRVGRRRVLETFHPYGVRVGCRRELQTFNHYVVVAPGVSPEQLYFQPRHPGAKREKAPGVSPEQLCFQPKDPRTKDKRLAAFQPKLPRAHLGPLASSTGVD